MGSKILNFFKRLSATKKVILCILAFLVTGYIFCLPRHLFHVPYSTVVTDRNEELLGARIASTANGDSLPETQLRKRSRNASSLSKTNISTTIGESIRSLSEELSIRM